MLNFGLETDISVSTAECKLIVEYSDDGVLIGKDLPLLKIPAKIGRSSSNHVIFRDDSPVSRMHATIEKIGSGYMVKEVVEIKDGVTISPKFGTFLDGERIDGVAALSDNSVIQLGPRLKLRFRSLMAEHTIIDKDGSSEEDEFDTLNDSSL